MRMLGLTRLKPASTVEDRKAFAKEFNDSLDALGIKPGDEFIIARADVTEERPPRVGCCCYCGVKIDATRDYCWEAGWAKQRARGSTAGVMKVATERWACIPCMDRMKHGVSPQQTKLA